MKKLVTRLEEKQPEEVTTFKTNMNKVMKALLARFDDFQLFTGENGDHEGMVPMMEYRDIDGESVPVMMFFKHGLVEEKL